MNGRSGDHFFIAVVALVLSACNACGPSAAEVRNATIQASTQLAEARHEGTRAALKRATANAVDEAQVRTSRAIDSFDLSGEPAYLAACWGYLASSELEQVARCVEEARGLGFDAIDFELVLAESLMQLGEYEQARAVLFGVRDRSPSTEGLQEQLLRSFSADQMFLRPVVTIERGVQVTRLRALGGGSTVTLKFKLDDETIAAFKPNQTRRQSNYRAEVAAFRLCPMIRCGFEVPYSFEVRIEQREFLRLYGIRSLEGQTGYAENFTDLVWTREDDHDYLHGVWKDWVPHFTGFPIEYDDVWDSWVSTNGDAAELEQSLEDALRPLRGRERGNYTEILDERGAATTLDLARQISNMLTFDFLINNWDRFSGAYYGVNCQWADGRFVSIDNGAGFMSRDPSRPRRRLHQVTRFSRSLVQEVRLMDPDSLLPILFPDPTEQEVESFEAFRERRQELLDYVDGLIEERGEDAVLFFE